MDTYVILRRDGWRSAEELGEAAARSTAVGETMSDDLRWIRSYVLEEGNGVGYEVDVPMSTFYNLPAVGSAVTLLTHFVVRDDAQLLYGFGSAAERQAFRELIRIAGVGPRTALSVLSGLSVAELAQAIARQDGARLVKVPGIGKKTAERLLLELKGRLAPELAAPLVPWDRAGVLVLATEEYLAEEAANPPAVDESMLVTIDVPGPENVPEDERRTAPPHLVEPVRSKALDGVHTRPTVPVKIEVSAEARREPEPAPLELELDEG